MGSCIFMPGAEDVAAMQERHDALERLYFADGRDKRDHPKHGTYTGLFTTNTTDRNRE